MGQKRLPSPGTTLLVVLFVLAAVPGVAVARAPDAAWAVDLVLREHERREMPRELRPGRAPSRGCVEARVTGTGAIGAFERVARLKFARENLGAPVPTDGKTPRSAPELREALLNLPPPAA